MHSTLHIVSICLRKTVQGGIHWGEDCQTLPICNLGRMVLHLTAMTGAGGSVEAWGFSALGHISIRHYRCGRARGKAICGHGKTTSKLATIECRGVATLLGPATSTSAATAVKTPESSPPCNTLVKAASINLSNYLVHVLMHEILLQSEMHKMLFSMLD